MNYGQRLRELRNHRGLTLQQVANATGTSIPYVSDVERGRRNAVSFIRKYQKALETLLGPEVQEVIQYCPTCGHVL